MQCFLFTCMPASTPMPLSIPPPSQATRGVFVNIALQEPFGLTVIEAAAHGVPTVATKNGGPVVGWGHEEAGLR